MEAERGLGARLDGRKISNLECRRSTGVDDGCEARGSALELEKAQGSRARNAFARRFWRLAITRPTTNRQRDHIPLCPHTRSVSPLPSSLPSPSRPTSRTEPGPPPTSQLTSANLLSASLRSCLRSADQTSDERWIGAERGTRAGRGGCAPPPRGPLVPAAAGCFDGEVGAMRPLDVVR